MIAFGNPYLIRQVPSVGTYLVTFGVGDALENAAAQAVLGRAPIGGTSPVSLPGFFSRGWPAASRRARRSASEEHAPL
jgi:beta-N-acetylhexosaminidase